MAKGPRKCGAFLADGDGTYDMNVWSVLTNTHKPPAEYGPCCADVVDHGKRRYRTRVVVEELPDSRRRVTPSMAARFRRLASSVLGSAPSKQRQAVPAAKPSSQSPPPKPMPTLAPASERKLKSFIKYIFKKQNLLFTLPVLFFLPVLTFLLMRAIYKHFFRRLKRKYRTKIRFVFIAVIVCSFFYALYQLIVTLHEIAFVD
ncbi:hypothetical protein LSAT2_002665 [Lamellibrachia satsuma]|nr:hypothetical protein LSAT2_002665 [Lamellibrachia satsuma]